MTSKSIVLVGGPDSGKTNYLGVLWALLISGNGCVKASESPVNIEYVESVLRHLNQGSFAPRSDRNLEARQYDLTVKLTRSEGNEAEPTELTVPDVRGEIWKKAIEERLIPSQWLEKLRDATGALLFLRIRSDQNVVPMDWVTAKGVLQALGSDQDPNQLPTQVFLCELLRLLDIYLKRDPALGRPRIAIVITAWDMLDEEANKAGPFKYLNSEYPLFAGRLADTHDLDVRIFGVSAVGGDLTDDEDFRQKFFDLDITKCGYVVTDTESGVARIHDIASPVQWLVSS